MVNKTIENLNNRNIDIKYKFQNQKMSTLAMEFLNKEFSNLPLSSMNESGDYVFSCDYIRNCQFNGWFTEPKSKDLNAYDYNKHYTSCLMGEGLCIKNKIFPIPFFPILQTRSRGKLPTCTWTKLGGLNILQYRMLTASDGYILLGNTLPASPWLYWNRSVRNCTPAVMSRWRRKIHFIPSLEQKKSECFATCELRKVSSELREKCILKHSFVIWGDLWCSGAIRGPSRPPKKGTAPLLQRKRGTGWSTTAFTPACTPVWSRPTGRARTRTWTEILP